MYVTENTTNDYDNITNDYKNITDNCTNIENNIDIITPTLLLTIPNPMWLIFFMFDEFKDIHIN